MASQLGSMININMRCIEITLNDTLYQHQQAD